MTKTILLSVIGALFLGAIIFFGYRARTLTPTTVICTLGDCPTVLHGYDSGERLLYSVGDHISVILDRTLDPPDQLTCLPEGVIRTSTRAPAAEPPLYAVAFEASSPGTCVLRSGDFTATIVVY